MKKSNIYTRGGDKGLTSLVGGVRVSKTAQRVESYGAVDELNSFTGLLIAALEGETDKDFLRFVQHKLFTIGSYLATAPEQSGRVGEGANHHSPVLTPGSIERIEQEIDRIDEALPGMKAFLLPGGSRQSALAHVCRTVCRRAEREIYRLAETATVEELILVFINRLSDYFFVLARQECLRNNGAEIIWDSTCI
jgi:cob(I)alamin adenosyltransferase